ncbi:MAG TPA: hypothetical protein VJV79_30915 [Polyangiaceae bacterium]|nr:hypothetical protein [Polyangiaceae bacterium]
MTLLALLLLGSSFVFRLRGGAQNPSLDAAQLLVVWGYLLGTPLLCALAWRVPKTQELNWWPNRVLFGLWLLIVVGSSFVHL